MIELTREDVTRLLNWWHIVHVHHQDVVPDYELAARLEYEERRLYEWERTR